MPDDKRISVYISRRGDTCAGCGESLHRGQWIVFERPDVLCLGCADLDHLVYLPAGNAALTRRSTKYSTASAVVLKWSTARKRNERQGVLVEAEALASAEEECLTDSDDRARRRERDAVRRERLDQEFIAGFAAKIRELFPGCPEGVENQIAEHACLKSSGRVGRSGAAKHFEEHSVRLAVVAHIRHIETEYDELLMKGYERMMARSTVRPKIEGTLAMWRG